jgi:DNA-binding MarR family transcriptional regulator
MKPEDIANSRAYIIWLLRHWGPVTQRTLADALGVTPRNVTGLVDALQASGYVVRAVHPTDRRAILVTLTAVGVTAAGETAVGVTAAGAVDKNR